VDPDIASGAEQTELCQWSGELESGCVIHLDEQIAVVGYWRMGDEIDET
jgi:hypothetical protein